MTREQNSGVPTAEELLEQEKELDAIADEAKAEKDPAELVDDDDEIVPPKKKEEKKPESTEDEDEAEDADKKSDEDDDDIDEDDDKKDDEDKDEPDGKKLVPAWKLKMQERRFNQEIEKTREDLRKEFEDKYGRKPDEEEKDAINDSMLGEFLKKYDLDEDKADFIKDLTGLIGKPTLPKEVLEKIAKLEEAQNEKDEEKLFEKDFYENKKVIDTLFPDLDSKQLDRFKAKVKELAYTDKYQKYALEDIIRLNKKALAPVERKKAGEPSSKGGSGVARQTVDTIDPDNIDWDNMSLEETERTMNALEKGQKSSRVKIYRKGQRIN